MKTSEEMCVSSSSANDNELLDVEIFYKESDHIIGRWNEVYLYFHINIKSRRNYHLIKVKLLDKNKQLIE